MSEKKKPETFIRTSSGLVRSFSPFLAFVFSSAILTYGSGIDVGVSWCAFLYSDANLAIALTISMIFGLFFGVLYALFMVAMPRSGGDYIWTSRVLHPAIGFVMNFVFTIWMWIWAGTECSILTVFHLSPALAMFGTAFRDPTLMSWSAMLLNPVPQYIVALILLFLCVVVISLGGKYLNNFLKVTWAIGMVGVGILLAIMAFATPQQFAAGFDNAFGIAGVTSYNSVISSAKDIGFSFLPLTLWGSIVAAPFGFFMYFGYHCTAYISGEIRDVKLSAPLSIVGVLVSAWVIESIAALLYYNVVGVEFNQAASFLYYMHPDKWVLPTSPMYWYFASLLTDNAFVQCFLGISLISWMLVMEPCILIVCVRNLFAWSFDRVLPTKLAKVSDKYSTPLYLSVIVTIGAAISLYVYLFTPYLVLTMNNTLAWCLALIIPGVAGALFPYIKKDFYEKSAIAKYKIGSVPMITIFGVLTAATFLFEAWAALAIPGVGGPTGAPALTVIVITFILPFIIYYASRAYHRSRGIDIELAFKEIPPS